MNRLVGAIGGEDIGQINSSEGAGASSIHINLSRLSCWLLDSVAAAPVAPPGGAASSVNRANCQ